MAEPRARASHHHHHRGQRQPNFTKELKLLMYAYGDDREPLEETVKILDELVTDFIIEMCHEAAVSATLARRQKIKVDDFRFALRTDAVKLGRVQELLHMDKVLKDWRKLFNENDDRLEKADVQRLGTGDGDGDGEGDGEGGVARGVDAAQGAEDLDGEGGEVGVEMVGHAEEGVMMR
ncbi:MAG: Transcription initiation factor TFIID subunit 13 [Phylliscum demangeonii]|nr:MAG: Transcription initiation factor TFIID subunit 13 [Phylliscum demangeonii]